MRNIISIFRRREPVDPLADLRAAIKEALESTKDGWRCGFVCVQVLGHDDKLSLHISTYVGDTYTHHPIEKFDTVEEVTDRLKRFVADRAKLKAA